MAAGEGADVGLGCGNPTAIASLRPGETVLDLGSGGGFDSFLAVRAVGPTGKVIGVDMTAEMITLARTNARKLETTNVELQCCEIALDARGKPTDFAPRAHPVVQEVPVTEASWLENFGDPIGT